MKVKNQVYNNYRALINISRGLHPVYMYDPAFIYDRAVIMPGPLISACGLDDNLIFPKLYPSPTFANLGCRTNRNQHS